MSAIPVSGNLLDLSDVLAGAASVVGYRLLGDKSEPMMKAGEQILLSVLGRRVQNMYPEWNAVMAVDTQYVSTAAVATLYASMVKEDSFKKSLEFALMSAASSYAGDLLAGLAGGDRKIL